MTIILYDLIRSIKNSMYLLCFLIICSGWIIHLSFGATGIAQTRNVAQECEHKKFQIRRWQRKIAYTSRELKAWHTDTSLLEKVAQEELQLVFSSQDVSHEQ